MKQKTNNLTPTQILIARRGISKDITTYTPTSLIRSVVGGMCVGVGIITLPLPTGSILLIMCGAGLIGYDVRALIKRIVYEMKLVKIKVYAWVMQDE